MLRSKQLRIALIALIVVLGIDVCRVRAQMTKSCNERKQPGLYCETCSLLATCLQLNETEWTSIPLDTCQTGWFCDSNLGRCSNDTGACFFTGGEINSLFSCTNVGIFPDPYDCQVYHTCYYEPGGVVVAGRLECEGDNAFDAASGTCHLSTSDPICIEKQYNCPKAGVIEPWPSNAHYYYVCKTLTPSTGNTVIFPEMHRCNDGYVFEGNKCVKANNGNGGTGGNTVGNNGSGSNGSTGNNGSTGDNGSTGGSGNTGGTPNSSSVCKKVGLNPDPNDCHKYYYCSNLDNPMSHTCTANTYYDQVMGACKIGTC